MNVITKSVARDLAEQKYKYGFITDIESETAPKGLSEDTVRFISAKKGEPEWLLEWRLKAYRHWLTLTEPTWAAVHHPPIDYQDAYYFSAPKKKLDSLDEVDPELLKTYEKLGIPLKEREILAGVQPRVAVDAVFDSVSVATTYKAELEKAGILFCPISEAVQTHPDLVKKYLGSVVPITDNFFATLNSAVFTDGSFVYIPKGVRCPMELSTYFRINAENTGQFERTLIIADEGAYVSYLEGCTAPKRDENQLHAAVVELVALDDAQIKYSTVQNWYPGDENGKGGIYNFVTKRGACRGKRSKISWTQVETGSAITWKYPSCVLQGDDSVGEFYSVAITNNYQQADTGTKMIHIGKNTRSTIISKGISAGKAQNTYRGQVKILRTARGARNKTQCDSLLIGDRCGAHTVPYIESRQPTARVEHEATTSKVSEDQLFYCMQRGLSQEESMALIVNGFCKEVLAELPMEFAVEAQKLVGVSLEGVLVDLPQFNDYLVFADEAGDHSMSPLDRDFPLFVLAFCIVERYHYADFIVPQILRLKLKYFPDTHVVLHERDIRRGEGDFSFLTNGTTRREFFTDLNELIERAQFKVIASVIQKERLLNHGGEKDLYDMGVSLGLKRLSIFLKLQELRQKDSLSPITVAFEARGKKEDSELKDSFSRIVQYPLYREKFRLKILPKVSNCCGLQLADLIARPIGRHVLKPDQANRAYDVIYKKIGSHEGKAEGHDLQIFP